VGMNETRKRECGNFPILKRNPFGKVRSCRFFRSSEYFKMNLVRFLKNQMLASDFSFNFLSTFILGAGRLLATRDGQKNR
jgi:hypothetical protein